MRSVSANEARALLPRMDMFYLREAGQLERWGTARFRYHLKLRAGARLVRRRLRRPDGGPMNATTPFMSVIVPVYQGARVLPRCLSALRASEMPPGSWELIIVDDASTDATALIAAEFADAVVRLPDRPRGPAYARNRGVEVARGEIVVFVDADVCVHTDTLRRFTSVFAHEPEVSAVFGAYDTQPEAPQLVSQYRNLLHHFVHSQSAGEAETFWGGCGAIRREVFIEAGRYDEWSYPRPQIEDVELGHRVRALGHRILLRPEIQCTHLKRWTLRGFVTGDFRDRGVPWTRMLIQQGLATKSRTLNLRTVEKLNTVLVWLSMVSLLGAAIWRSWQLCDVGGRGVRGRDRAESSVVRLLHANSRRPVRACRPAASHAVLPQQRLRGAVWLGAASPVRRANA